ncbi:5-hydroxytryptamine receptor 1E-like isoform X1 [Hypomesus transpacificus]|uniref:5-hydroxytryptamine receptor 1E-like isoform X1 n=1 Tax=Hypomesus transpacificus TaxID=137520 RepID=UPI001F075A09|nr:5-hydroxytryptamine receptor 1E-like isoform X1 [Hypomesus transpacificus]XP_046906709.1 5-hydroxytryptamine receptor 1E-like isoform X1 [Hypomesus transpacificus]XP_046906718.1 5-hydroxytryptamine receptor 1E-like isoform X1 [Hypomesus transpacificus]
MLVVIVLSVITSLTALINGSIILVILTTKKLQLPANYLICSMASTDFLVAILVMPLSIVYIAKEKWLLGVVVCEAWLSMDMTCCTCSILHLCAIALDRHWAITKALEYACKRTPRHAAIMVIIVWTFAILISVPPLFWRYNLDKNSIMGNETQCFIEHDHIGYTIYSTFGAFYIPLVLILVLYYRIFIAARTLYQRQRKSSTLCERRARGESLLHGCHSVQSHCMYELATTDPKNPMELQRLKAPVTVSQMVQKISCERTQVCTSRERKAAWILGLIIGAFVFCWLPFFLKELLVGLQVLQQASPQVCEFLTWLGYINSLINPLLYTSFNQDFKQAFKKLLRPHKRMT